MSARELESANERDGAIGEGEDPELTVLNFRGQLQCRMKGEQDCPVEAYPKVLEPGPLSENY